MIRYELIKDYLLRIFDIKEDELKKTLLLQLNIFLLISTLLIVKPTVNSLFLSELTSDALPLGYVLTAIAAVIGSYFYNKTLERTSLNKVIENTLIGSILLLVIFGITLKFELVHGYFLYLPYIFVAIFGLLTASQFWILSNLVYNIREAKRIFGFIGAGAIAGGIFGGYITSILTRFLEAEDLLFVAAVMLMFCIRIMRFIWVNEVMRFNLYQLSKRTAPIAENPYRVIRKSELLTLIALVGGVSVLVAKLVDYQYSDYASRLIGDPEELASFFGFWFSTLSVVSLLIQLFLTKRIVGVFGVGRSLLWLPAGILIGSLLLLFIPELWVVVLIKVVDGSLKQSVNKAATELLSIPIPLSIKKKTKTFIDVVVDSIATGLAGLLLIFFINGMDLPAQYVSLIIIALISGWLYLILRLKNAYINSFRASFVGREEKKKKIREMAPITSILDSVRRVLNTGTENQIRYMLGKTQEAPDERLSKDIVRLLDHPVAEIRKLAIENLYFLAENDYSKIITNLLGDPDQEVTTAAFRYLLKFHQGDRVEFFEQYLSSNDITISNAALLGLSLELRNHEKLQRKFNLIKKIESALDRISRIPDPERRKIKLGTVIRAIGNARVTWHYSLIDKHINDEDPDIAKVAILSASQSLDEHFIDPIIANLKRREVRVEAIQALNNYGDSVIDALLEKLRNADTPLEITRTIPEVIGSFATPKAVRALLHIIDDYEHDVKIEAIEALRVLRWEKPDLEIRDRLVIDKVLDECELYQQTLAAIHTQIIAQYRKGEQHLANPEVLEARNGLVQLLENRLGRQVKRIFKYLGLKYPPADIDSVLEVMLKGEDEQRIHALEFLDNILDAQLKKEFMPIAETTIIDAAYEEKIKKLNLRVPTEAECFISLMERNDNKLKMAVLYLLEQMGDPKYLSLAQRFTEDRNKPLQDQARRTVTRLSEISS